MFGEVERLSEILPTDITVERLFPCVHPIVTAKGLASAEPTATDGAQVWSLPFPTWSTRVAPSTLHDNFAGAEFPLLPGLPGTLGFGIGVLLVRLGWVRQRHHGPAHALVTPSASSVRLVHFRSRRWAARGYSHRTKAETSQQTSNDIPSLLTTFVVV